MTAEDLGRKCSCEEMRLLRKVATVLMIFKIIKYDDEEFILGAAVEIAHLPRLNSVL